MKYEHFKNTFEERSRVGEELKKLNEVVIKKGMELLYFEND